MKERYEHEIEQLLSELDSEPADGQGPPAPDDAPPPLDDQPSPFTPRPRQSARLISPGKLALAGVVLAVVGLLLPVLKWLSITGLAVYGRSDSVDVRPTLERRANPNLLAWPTHRLPSPRSLAALSPLALPVAPAVTSPPLRHPSWVRCRRSAPRSPGCG